MLSYHAHDPYLNLNFCMIFLMSFSVKTIFDKIYQFWDVGQMEFHYRYL